MAAARTVSRASHREGAARIVSATTTTLLRMDAVDAGRRRHETGAIKRGKGAAPRRRGASRRRACET